MEAFCQGGGPAPTTASASTTDGSSAVTGAGGGAVVGAGSGAAPSTGPSDNWIAGETPNQEFDGQVVASSGCGVARSSLTSRPSDWGWMATFGAALAFALFGIALDQLMDETGAQGDHRDRQRAQ